MKIKGIKIGYATNSSSYHNTIVVDGSVLRKLEDSHILIPFDEYYGFEIDKYEIVHEDTMATELLRIQRNPDKFPSTIRLCVDDCLNIYARLKSFDELLEWNAINILEGEITKLVRDNGNIEYIESGYR